MNERDHPQAPSNSDLDEVNVTSISFLTWKLENHTAKFESIILKVVQILFY